MRIDRDKSIALIVDIQKKLAPHIRNNEALIKRIQVLIKGLQLLGIPMVLNEQYKKGLGETVEDIKSLIPEVKNYEKITFSCCQNTPTLTHILESGRRTAIVMGMETHICVMQTCNDLIASGIHPVLVIDCVGSRYELDHDIAIKRMIQSGVTPATVESVLFELCKNSKDEAFKEISALVK
jgi:nicotinamidase-related amidase